MLYLSQPTSAHVNTQGGGGGGDGGGGGWGYTAYHAVFSPPSTAFVPKPLSHRETLSPDGKVNGVLMLDYL